MKEVTDNEVKWNYGQHNIESIIEYIYTEHIELNDENIKELTDISHYLQVIYNIKR